MKGNKSILILERDHLLRFLYKEELADEGYITIFADDNRDVLQKIEEFSPDLFITNYEISSTESFTAMLHQTSEKRTYANNHQYCLSTGYDRCDIVTKWLSVSQKLQT